MEALVRLAKDVKLTKLQSANLVELLEELEPVPGGGGGYDSDPMSATVLDEAKLAQKMTRDDLKPAGTEQGDIYVPGIKIAGIDTPIIVTPVYGWESRMRWPDGERPDCWSHTLRYSAATGDKCASCPDSKWEDKTPPDCTQQWNWIFLAEDMSRMFYVAFRKTSHGVGQSILKLTKGRAGRKLFELSSYEKSGGRNTWAVWKASPLGAKPSEGSAAFAKGIAPMLAEQIDKFKEETSVPPEVTVEATGADSGPDGPEVESAPIVNDM